MNEKYKALTDRLIQSDSRDSCIKTNIDNKLKSFDCCTYFIKEFAAKLAEHEDFRIRLLSKD